MPDTEFNELGYLRLHEDVRRAVARGSFKSALEHYERYGKAEGRKDSRFDLESHSIKDYTRLVRQLVAAHPGNLDLAMAKAVGSLTLEDFRQKGDLHYEVLRRFGLQEGVSLYDLACGSGRTAAALGRNGWSGHYLGADIIPELVAYAEQTNPGYRFIVHPDYSIEAPDNSQDMVCAWSLFTHLQLEETFLYAKDSLRALKPGGLLLFSFLTLADPVHRQIFLERANALERGIANAHLDMFLDKPTLSILLQDVLGFQPVAFVDADDVSATPSGKFGQALAVFRKAPAEKKRPAARRGQRA